MPDISDITPIPTGATAAQIDAHPIADAVKTSLAAALTGVETSHITITGITIGAASGRRLRRRLTEANSVHADYTIALPKTSATTVKAAAATELANIPAVIIPAAVMIALAGCFCWLHLLLCVCFDLLLAPSSAIDCTPQDGRIVTNNKVMGCARRRR